MRYATIEVAMRQWRIDDNDVQIDENDALCGDTVAQEVALCDDGE